MTGRFKKGQSGNPAGRPRGIPNPSTRLRAAIAQYLPEIIDVLRQQALAGDVSAARLLLERCLPALKPQSEPGAVSVSGMSLAERAEAIAAAAVTGQLPPDTASDLMAVLSSHARIKEVAELEVRITALEERAHAQTGRTD